MSENTKLVLARKEGESLTIQVPDSDGTTKTIFIDIAKIGTTSIKVLVEAPSDVSILRYELTV